MTSMARAGVTSTDRPSAAPELATERERRVGAPELRRALREARSEIVALESERDGLLAALRQMSAPVIPIHEDIVVMPLVGDARAQKARAEAGVLRRAKEQAHAVDSALAAIAEDAEELAAYASQLFASAHGSVAGGLWDARASMFRLSEGQLVNGPCDLISFFVPRWVDVDDAIFDRLNIASRLGPMLKTKVDRDPRVICAYVFAKGCRYMGIYPNGEPSPERLGGILADELPPDFGLSGDPVFWGVGDELSNPERVARWTTPYVDNVGKGLIVSAIAPVYEPGSDTPSAMVGVDVSLSRLREVIEAAAAPSRIAHEGAVVVDERGHLVVATDLAHERLGLERPDAVVRGVSVALDLTSAGPLSSTVIEAMRRGETGAVSLAAVGADLVFAYAPIATIGWCLGVVTASCRLDSDHGSSLVETLLAGIERYRARVAILDVTGVASIDGATIQRILEAVSAARLLGADVLMAGITPGVAHAILALGRDLDRLRTYPDLRAALRAAERDTPRLR